MLAADIKLINQVLSIPKHPTPQTRYELSIPGQKKDA